MTSTGICFLNPSQTLAEALQDLNSISRSQLIKKGLSKKDLNRRVEAKAHFDLSLDILNFGLINPIYSGEPIMVLDETDDLMILEKPVKTHCHPLQYLESDNILSALRELGHGEILKINHSNYDRGLLYRLDYETSGLLIYIKNENLLADLRGNFHERVKRKTYLAQIKGKLDQEKEFHHLIGPGGIKGSKMKEVQDGKPVSIKVKPTKIFENTTLVEVELNEGARHQIRVQLSLAGYPIVGDPIYSDNPLEDYLHLHCYKYEIESIGTFQATLPPWYTL